jgi:hypothetical protein
MLKSDVVSSKVGRSGDLGWLGLVGSAVIAPMGLAGHASQKLSAIASLIPKAEKGCGVLDRSASDYAADRAPG